MSWQVESFWEKVKDCSISVNEIEKYIYSSEYLGINNPIEYCKINSVYNSNLFQYVFEVENYQSETDYREICFQGFLDGEIDEKEYYNAENSFVEFINCLSNKSDVYIYYDFIASFDNCYPLHKSNDVNFDIDFIKKNEGNFFRVIDKFKLKQISIMFAREIVSGYIVLDRIRSIFVSSGMHGIILSDQSGDGSLC